MHTVRKINLPGRHCQCGALRTGNDKRCQKCQARSGWYRHHCRRPPACATSHTPGASIRKGAETPTRCQPGHHDEES